MSVTEVYPSEPPDEDAFTGGRVPPQDLGAEQSVLGAMLLSKNAIDPAADTLQGRDFYRPSHELIFEVITDMYGRGEPADAITVAAELQRRGDLAKIGGAPYLHTLVAGVPTAASVDYYAAIVHEKAVLRRLVEVGTRIQQIGYDQTGEVAELVDQAQAAVLDVDGDRGAEDYSSMAELMPLAIQEIEDIASRDGEMAGVESGFPDIDTITTGFRPGQMIVVAARPGVGKSTIGLDFVRAAAVKGDTPCAIFSLEMTAAEIAMRLLSAEAKVSIGHMRGGTVNKFDWDAISRAMPRVMGAPIVIDDSPNMTMPQIRSKARRIAKDHGLGMIVIDYLQLMTSGKRVENRQVEVSEFSRQIKLLAKELEIPVVAISQLNRGSEARSDKVPQLSDLRESGSIEQDADVVMLLHRPDMHGGGDGDRPGEADVIIAKNRSGPAGVKVAVTFQGHYSRFTPMARDEAPPPAADAAAAGDFF
ncbi:MAG: replicative DNA helicase [Aeromicrobium sp.]|uniref:replicative DNA helicase n=1 Tax=Aeromicrobium sp. TaxID=1871063 RepID=UPI0039E33C6B